MVILIVEWVVSCGANSCYIESRLSFITTVSCEPPSLLCLKVVVGSWRESREALIKPPDTVNVYFSKNLLCGYWARFQFCLSWPGLAVCVFLKWSECLSSFRGTIHPLVNQREMCRLSGLTTPLLKRLYSLFPPLA